VSDVRASQQVTSPAIPGAIPDDGSARGVPFLVLLFLLSIAILGQAVLIEPAPIDVVLTILGVVLIILGLRLSFIGLAAGIVYLGLSGVPLILNHVSSTYAGRYFIIESYLIFSCLVLYSMLTRWPTTQRLLVRWIARAAAIGSTLILALHFLTVAPLWLYRSGVRFRLKGAFEDPNVLGPFLILPILYFLECEKGWRRLWAVPPLFLLFLTYSRGAWVAIGVSITVLVFGRRILRVGSATRAILLLVGVAALAMALLQFTGVGDDVSTSFERRARYQQYDDRRFDILAESVNVGLNNPMGLGAGEFLKEYGLSAHDLFLGKVVDAGVIPALMLVSLVFLAMIRLLQACRRYGDQISFVLLATLCGQIATSLTIYSHHWRHLWVIVVIALARTHTLLKQNHSETAAVPATSDTTVRPGV